MTQVLDLVPIWTAILALAVFFYVLLDGFDLGVGMLYGLASGARSRNTIMNSIAPVWDGNETWLLLGGIGLFAAFPTAFAVIIPAVYFPILVMGLYTIVPALLAYALLGTSRQLVVGPDTATGLISAITVGAIATQGTAEFNSLTSTLAVLIGLFFFCFGVMAPTPKS